MFTIGVIYPNKKESMFNPFKKKAPETESTPAISPEQSSVSQFLIITAATNFGLIVMPQTKKPLMYKMEPNETIADCVNRNAAFITAAVDVSTCLVIQLAAELPNHTHAANKIFALILPDPGILINQDMVVVGYEEIDKMPGATNSMLQMLVKQVPQEYYAEPKVEAGWHNDNPNTAPSAIPSTPVVSDAAVPAPEVIASEPVVTPQEQVVPTEPFDPIVAPVEQPVVTPAPENPSQTA